MVNLVNVNLLHLAANFHYGHHLQTIAHSSIDQVTFLSYDDSFVTDILGPNYAADLVVEMPWDAFHEAGAFVCRLLHTSQRFTLINTGTTSRQE